MLLGLGFLLGSRDAVDALPPNFPPVARAAASAEEVLVGKPVRFSAAASSDPDGGPSPLSYLWEFDDGETSTLRDPEHAYARPGAYVATLTVDDGADTAVDVVTVHVLLAPAPGSPARTTPLALSPMEETVWVVNEDSDSVSVLALEEAAPGATKLAEIRVGKRPRTLAFSRDGTSLYVTEQDSNTLTVIDVERRQVLRTLPVGHRPYGVVTVPEDGRILVSLQGEGAVAILDQGELSRRKLLPVPGFPRAIAVSHDGSRALVTHFLSAAGAGKVTVIDLEREEAAATIDLPLDPGPDTPSSGRGVPNLLSAIAIEPGGTAAWVGGLKSNVQRGRFRSGEVLGAVNRVRGVLAKLDLVEGREVLERRIDLNNADSGSAIAFSPSGRYAYVTHQGLGALSIYDLAAATLVRPGEGSTVPFASRIELGAAPQGIMLDGAGTRGYVLCFLSREIVVLDLDIPEEPAILGRVQVTAEPLPPAIASGKRHFFSSAPPVHSSAGYVACASCHADGGMHDGQTWDFTDAGEGLRNTTDLRGRGGLAHGPVHWSANFDEIQDFENDIVKGFGGTGLAMDGEGPHPPLGAPNAGRGAALDDLAAYVSSLAEVPPSPYRDADGSLTAAALRGGAIFFRDDTACASCHVPPRFTDSVLTPDPADFVLHDVGTITPASGARLGGPLPGIDTPTLKGVRATAPYLHDGSASTLLDVLTARNREDRHGRTSHLTAADLEDLVAFLLSLDERPVAIPPQFRRGDSNCDGAVTLPDAVFVLDWLFLGAADPCCMSSADATSDGKIDISDAIFVLTWLYLDGRPPAAPGPFDCGLEPGTTTALECSRYPEERC